MKRLYITFATFLIAATSFSQSSLRSDGVFRKGDDPAQLANKIEAQAKVTALSHKLNGPKVTWNAPLSEDVITTQPKGVLHKNLYRKSKGYFSLYGSIFSKQVDGYANDLVEGEDGYVYFNEPYSQISTYSWLKGKKTEGDTLAFDFPQPIFKETVKGVTQTFYAFKMVPDTSQVWDDAWEEYVTVISWVPDSVSQTMKFVWRGDSLVKVGTELLGLATAEGGFVGYGDNNIVFKKIEDEPVEIPTGAGTPESYAMHYVNAESGAKDFKLVSTLVNGNDIYVKGLVTTKPDAWVKGSLTSDNKAVFTKQYIGVDAPEGKPYHTWFFPAKIDSVQSWGSWTLEPSEEKQVSFTIDTTDKTMKTTGGVLINLGYNNPEKNYIEAYAYPSFEPFTEVAATPDDPTIVKYIAYDDKYGFGIFRFDLPKTGTRGEMLDVHKMYYNIYIDDEILEFEKDIYTRLNESTTDIPYNFADAYDFVINGLTHSVYFYVQGFDKIGVSQTYTGGGEKHSSNIVSYDVKATGITGTKEEQKIVGEKYFDLSGREVTHPTSGLYVKTLKFADGSQKTFKVLKK